MSQSAGLDGYPASSYGLFDTGSQAAGPPSETNKIPRVSTAIVNAGTIWHKDSPLLVLGVILALTIGAAGVTASGRVGPAKASLALGDPK